MVLAASYSSSPACPVPAVRHTDGGQTARGQNGLVRIKLHLKQLRSKVRLLWSWMVFDSHSPPSLTQKRRLGDGLASESNRNRQPNKRIYPEHLLPLGNAGKHLADAMHQLFHAGLRVLKHLDGFLRKPRAQGRRQS